MTAATDTIVAAATPPGIGGVAIVRLSGPRAAHIGAQIAGDLPSPRRADLRRFRDAAGDAVDDGLVLWFPGPASFTGEDVVELHCHGGPVVTGLVEAAAIAFGARRAAPGEFSRRAFENGKLDLVQAEAVADLIASGSAQAARAALRSLSGEFSRDVHALAERLVVLRTWVEAAIDFPDEDIDFLADEDLRRRLDSAEDAFAALVARTESGRALRDGLRVVITGAPNAGKSSLMNALSGDETAIVTEVAGTTRDILRERIDLGGHVVELVDTAGLRDDPDRIEAEGIRRAQQAIETADVVLRIRAADQLADHPADRVAQPSPDAIALDVVNKIDLGGPAAGTDPQDPDTLRVSAVTGAGLEALRDRLRELAGGGDYGEGAFTARRRHVEALAEARRHFDAGRAALAGGRSGELLAEELRLALDQLVNITGGPGGDFAADDLLGRIFGEFCIGK